MVAGGRGRRCAPPGTPTLRLPIPPSGGQSSAIWRAFLMARWGDDTIGIAAAFGVRVQTARNWLSGCTARPATRRRARCWRGAPKFCAALRVRGGLLDPPVEAIIVSLILAVGLVSLADCFLMMPTSANGAPSGAWSRPARRILAAHHWPGPAFAAAVQCWPSPAGWRWHDRPVPISRTSSPRSRQLGFPRPGLRHPSVARRGLRVAGAALSALRQDGLFKGPSAIISERKMYENSVDSASDARGEQRGAALLPGSIGRREGSDAGSQDMGAAFIHKLHEMGQLRQRNGAHGVARLSLAQTHLEDADARRSPYRSLTYPVTRRGLRVGLIFLLDFPAVATRAAGAFRRSLARIPSVSQR